MNKNKAASAAFSNFFNIGFNRNSASFEHPLRRVF